MSIQILQGNAFEKIREISEGSVHCCVTSPPYWGLRKYDGDPFVWSGDANCEHEWGPMQGVRSTVWPARSMNKGRFATQNKKRLSQGPSQGNFCQLCDAWLGHVGLEPTIELYIAHLVEIFREVWRVLHRTGTCFVVIGDCYATSGKANSRGQDKSTLSGSTRSQEQSMVGFDKKGEFLKDGDLVDVPGEFSWAMVVDGWHRRWRGIWHKKNCMPESVKNRPTIDYEFIWMFSKSQRYFYDYYAILEPLAPDSIDRAKRNRSGGKYRAESAAEHSRLKMGQNYGPDGDPEKVAPSAGRNKRSVWSVPTEGSRYGHYAAYPINLIEPMLLAGTSKKGCCPKCLAPWRRILGMESEADDICMKGGALRRADARRIHELNDPAPRSGRRVFSAVGWEATCKCNAGDPIPCTVLDPFAGTGTTLVVADRLGLNGIGIELSEKYIQFIYSRLANEGEPMFRRGRPKEGVGIQETGDNLPDSQVRGEE